MKSSNQIPVEPEKKVSFWWKLLKTIIDLIIGAICGSAVTTQMIQ